MIESGEADALLWVDALAASGVEWPHGVPTVVLSASGLDEEAAGDVLIAVGCPGRDHDAALYLSVAEVLTGISRHIEARTC